MKGSRCFLQQENLASLLSTDWFQECKLNLKSNIMYAHLYGLFSFNEYKDTTIKYYYTVIYTVKNINRHEVYKLSIQQ